MIDDERVPEHKVLLCYNGIDLSAFQPPLSRSGAA